MKTWIWPFSLYQRIHDLEAIVAKLAHHNDELTKRNKGLVNQLAGQSIANAGAISVYISMMEGVMQQSATAYRQMAERQRPPILLPDGSFMPQPAYMSKPQGEWTEDETRQHAAFQQLHIDAQRRSGSASPSQERP